MQSPWRILVAVALALGALVVSAGCDTDRSAPTQTSEAAQTPAAAQADSVPTETAAAQPAATLASAATPTPAPSELATMSQPGAQPGTPAPAGFVGGSLYETVIRVYRDARPSVVTVISSAVAPGFRSEPQPQGTGSGFMIDDQGHVLTNNHVVVDGNRLEITLANGTTLQARLIGRDPRFDLAVIQADIPADQVRALPLGDSDQVLIGEQAIAIGNPYGLDGTVTQGIVSGRRPAVTEPSGSDGVLINAIQTDTSINPGNSGGPLFNARGEVIGVNTLGLMPNGNQSGLNFAIPINNARRILPDLMAGRSYPHPFVGVTSAEITGQIARTLGLSATEGLLVQSVEPSSGAARAGLRGGSQQREVGSRRVTTGGDVVIAIDGQKVRRPEDLIAYLELNKRAGEVTRIALLRDGEQREVDVTLGERPRSEGRPSR
jgi:2-alkenal reductase